MFSPKEMFTAEDEVRLGRGNVGERVEGVRLVVIKRKVKKVVRKRACVNVPYLLPGLKRITPAIPSNVLANPAATSTI